MDSHLGLLGLVGLVGLHLVFFSVRTAVIAGAVMRFLVRSPFGQLRRVYRRDYTKGQFASELRAAVVIVTFDAVVLALVRHFGLVHAGPVTLGRTALTFLAVFVWYEVWFYATHRALHTKWLAPLHAQHHTAKVAHPLTSLSFSIAERAVLQLGAIGFVVLASRIAPLSLAGVVGYFFVNYVLNVLGHSNVEFAPEGFPKSVGGRVFITTTYHAMHHARYSGHYGLFTTFLDRWFGTTWDDYAALHQRAVKGDGPARLGERVATSEAVA